MAELNSGVGRSPSAPLAERSVPREPMKASRTLITIFMAAIIGGTPIGSQVDTASALLDVRNGSLGWAGIHIGTTRRSVQLELGHELPVESDPDTPTCGDFESSLALFGHNLRIQWSSAADDATVESLTVLLTAAEIQAGANELIRAVRNRLPALERVAPESDPNVSSHFVELRLSKNPSHVALVKFGSENVIIVSLEACLD